MIYLLAVYKLTGKKMVLRGLRTLVCCHCLTHSYNTQNPRTYRIITSGYFVANVRENVHTIKFLEENMLCLICCVFFKYLYF